MQNWARHILNGLCGLQQRRTRQFGLFAKHHSVTATPKAWKVSWGYSHAHSKKCFFWHWHLLENLGFKIPLYKSLEGCKLRSFCPEGTRLFGRCRSPSRHHVNYNKRAGPPTGAGVVHRQTWWPKCKPSKKHLYFGVYFDSTKVWNKGSGKVTAAMETCNLS